MVFVFTTNKCIYCKCKCKLYLLPLKLLDIHILQECKKFEKKKLKINFVTL